MKNLAVVLSVLLLFATFAWATGPGFYVPGVSWTSTSLQVGATSIAVSSTTCRPGGSTTTPETPALFQVTANGVYFTVDGSAVASNASYAQLGTGDWFYTRNPSNLRMTTLNAPTASVVFFCYTPS